MVEEGNGIYVIDWTYWDCVHVHRAVSRCIAGVWIIFMLGILYRVLEGNLTGFMGTKYLNVALPGLHSCWP